MQFYNNDLPEEEVIHFIILIKVFYDLTMNIFKTTLRTFYDFFLLKLDFKEYESSIKHFSMRNYKLMMHY